MSTFLNCLKNNRSVLTGILVLAGCMAVSVFGPGGAASSSELWSAFTGGGNKAAQIILYDIRLPRTIACVLCGSGLSAAGLLLQEALSNPLASPGIMGINSGAGFFVLLASVFLPGAYLARNIASFAGAMCAGLLVFLISRKAGSSRSMIILSGVAVSTLMTAGVNTIITFRPDAVADKVSFSLGGFSGVDAGQLPFPAVIIIAGLIAALVLSGGIELFAIGDEAAEGLGLAVARHRVLTMICAALLGAASVSICGLLGFIGLIIPNLFRMFAKCRVSKMLVLCVLWGSSFLLFTDTLMRTIFYPYELPAGLLMSLFGTPFFIYILMKRGRRGSRHD